MSEVIDNPLDTWMQVLHGDKYTDALELRLATLVFCASLPKTASSELLQYKEGTTCVELKLLPSAQEHIPIEPPRNTLLDELMYSCNNGLTRKIYIPKQFIFANHTAGAAILKNMVFKELNCDTIVMTNNNALCIELYHRCYKRWIIFSLSDQ